MTDTIRCTNSTQFNCSGCDDPRKMIPDSYCYRYIASLAECGEFIDDIGIEQGQQIINIRRNERRAEFEIMLKLIEMGEIAKAAQYLTRIGFNTDISADEIDAIFDEHNISQLEIQTGFGPITLGAETVSKQLVMGVCDLKRMLNTITDSDMVINLIRDKSDLMKLGERILSDGACCVMAMPCHEEVIGISVIARDGTAFYIPINHRNPAVTYGAVGRRVQGQLQQAVVSNFIRPWVESGNVKMVSHGWHMMSWYSFRKLMRLRSESMWWDTSIAEYIIDSRRQRGLSDLTERYLKTELLKFSDGDNGIAETARWLCRAASMVSKICKIQFAELKSMDMLGMMKLEMDSLPTISEMAYRGLRVDNAVMNNEIIKARKHIDDARGKITKIAGSEFNPGSDTQVQEYIFRKLKIGTVPDWKLWRLAMTGGELPRVNSENMAKIKLVCSDDHRDFIDAIMAYRGWSKYLNTYAGKIIGLVDEHSIVRFNIDQIGTLTGRPSSKEPNILNLPSFINKTIPVDFKSGIRPKLSGNKFVIGDFCQQELRKYAVMARIEPLIHAFESGIDIHQLTGDQICPAEWSKERRRKVGKSLNFGMVFGMGYFKLADDTGMSLEEAKKVLTIFKAKYNINAYRDKVEKFFLANGYVRTALGRRRYFERANYKDNMNSMVNHTIQGTAADYQKIKLAEIRRELSAYSEAIVPVLTVYDDIAVECHPQHTQLTTDIMNRVMNYTFEHDGLKIPMTADIVVSDSLKKY